MAQTTWVGMSDLCSVKGEWVEHGLKGHEVRDSKNVQVQYRLGKGTHGACEVTFLKRFVPDKR